MAKLHEIKNNEDKKDALDFVRRKIKGLTIPKRSHEYILKLTDALIDQVKEMVGGTEIKLAVSSGLGEKTIKIIAPTKLPENLEAYCKNNIISYSTDFLSVRNKDGKGSITITVKGSASYALIKTFITVGIALLVSILLNSFGSIELVGVIQTYLTYPIESLFINALQMIATPVTFFAIICTTSFFYSYLRDGVLGRKLF